jgi:hypothetical protein
VKKRFKRQLAPGFWEDTDGAVHISIPDVLAHFGLEDTPENRSLAVSYIRGGLAEMAPTAKTIETD